MNGQIEPIKKQTQRPMSEVTNSKTSHRSQNIPSGTGPVILVVANEPTLLASLEALLTHDDQSLCVAEDGHDAIEICARHPERIMLLLIDEELPGTDAHSTFATIQQANSAIRCGLFSDGKAPTGKQTIRRLHKPILGLELVLALSGWSVSIW